MAQAYNFDGSGLPESFDFGLLGHVYRMRYPTTEELERALDMQDDPQRLADYQYSFITPASEGAPSVKEALADKSIILRNQVNAMIRKEFQREA